MGRGRNIVKWLAPESMPRIFYELVFIGFAIMMGLSVPSSFLPILAQSLDPSGLLVGLVVSAWFMSRIFLELPAGIISDRIGRRRLLLFGLGLSALGPLLCSLASNIYILILGRVFWGMGTAFYFMNNTAMLMDILPAVTRGRALGLFQGIEFIGIFIGAPIGAFMTAIMTYNQVFYFTLALTLISLIIAAKSESLRRTEVPEPRRVVPPFREVFSSLRNWGIAAVCLTTMLRMLIVMGVFQTVFQLYLKQSLLLSITLIGVVLSFRVGGRVVSLLPAGILSDKYGRKPVLVAGYMICGLGLFAFTLVKNFQLLLLISFIEGLGEGFGMTPIVALLTDITPRRVRGGAIGLYRTFLDIGGFAGPVLFMLIYSIMSAMAIFYIATIINILNIIIVSTIRTKDVAIQ